MTQNILFFDKPLPVAIRDQAQKPTVGAEAETTVQHGINKDQGIGTGPPQMRIIYAQR